MKNENLVSVVIPVYNGEKYIRETVLSAIHQSYPFIEIIVINDGSTDSTSSILDELKNKFPTLIIQHIPNSGVSMARNEGLKRATGMFISFLDADDVWEKNNIELKVNFLLHKKNAFGVTSAYEIMDENSQKTGKNIFSDYSATLDDILFWKGNYITIPSGILFDRSILIHSGGFNPELSNNADQELIMRLMASGKDFFCMTEITWLYRRHSSNMSSDIQLMESDTVKTFKLATQNKYFRNHNFRLKCMSKMALILGYSWIKNASNYSKGFYWMTRSFLYSPVYFLYDLFERSVNSLKP